MKRSNTFRTGGTPSTPGAAHGGDLRGLRAGIVASLLFGNAVLGGDAQVRHQRICFLVESELGSRHKLIFIERWFSTHNNTTSTLICIVEKSRKKSDNAENFKSYSIVFVFKAKIVGY